jgi:hypothetical protein
MPKPKIAQLVQSPKGDDAEIVNLAAEEVAVITGDMGGCVSVVVLWNPVNGVFQNVRGHHASGGAANLDWDAVMEGVPAGQNTLVVMAYSRTTDESDVKRVREAVDKQVKTRRSFVMHTNCMVDRNSPTPTIRDFDQNAEGANYRIRAGRRVI